MDARRWVKTVPNQRRGTAPQVWHVNPNCPALDGHDILPLTSEDQNQIERLTGRLLRPCRLCSK